MVRGTLTINTKLERARLTRWQKKPNGLVFFSKATEFQLQLTKNGVETVKMATAGDFDTYSNNITTTMIMETAVQTAGRGKPPRQQTLSIVTRQLREKRR